MDNVTTAADARDNEIGRGKLLFTMIADGYSGEQIVHRFGIAPDRIEELVALYVRRVVRGDAPPAPTAECRINGYDGWCMKHGRYHPAHCPDPWQPAHPASSRPDDCATCSEHAELDHPAAGR